jgi:hypothetical protein
MSASLQLVGALLVLVPFAWSQLGSLGTETAAYLWPNLLGSTMLAALAVLGSQWGFVLLESCWALATGWSLIRGPSPAAVDGVADR